MIQRPLFEAKSMRQVDWPRLSRVRPRACRFGCNLSDWSFLHGFQESLQFFADQLAFLQTTAFSRVAWDMEDWQSIPERFPGCRAPYRTDQ